MKKILLYILSLSLAQTVYGQLYHPGEVLEYRVSYKAKLFPNTEVGAVKVTTSEADLNGKKTYKIEGHGKTLPAYRLFFPLDDKYTIWIDPATLRTQRFEADIHESNYTFRSEYVYDWVEKKVHTSWRKKESQHDQHKTMSLSDVSMDAVSLFFNMRTADTDKFKEGDQKLLQMVLEDTIRHLRYRFIGREEKKIRGIGRFHTLKFACQLGTSEGFSFTDGSEFFIWISDDRNKIPLYIESPIRIGSIQAYITGYKGLKYPLTSLIK